MSFFDDDPRRDAGGSSGRLNFSLEPLLGIVPFVVLRAAASAGLTLTTSSQDVVGATVTIRHLGVWVIMGVFDFDGAGDADGVGELNIDGVLQPSVALHDLATFNRGTASQNWLYAKDALGPEVLQLRGRKVSGGGNSLIQPTHTTIMAFTVPGSETLPV